MSGHPQGESVIGRRALVVGVQTYLDPGIHTRPGTSAALRQLGGLLEQTTGNAASETWEVRALLDDEPAEDRRPILSNLLEGLAWLSRCAAGGLLVLSGQTRAGRFLPRDARSSMLERTSLGFDELGELVPTGVLVVLDALATPDVLPEAVWVLAAGPAEGAPSFLGHTGPSRFLHAVLGGCLGKAAVDGQITAASLESFVAADMARQASQVDIAPPWSRGSSSALMVIPPDATAACDRCGLTTRERTATFCPGCGASLRVAELLDAGRYRLLRTVGSGGMGQVFLADDRRLGVQRAIKLLSVPAEVPPAEVESLRARMIQEARAAQSLGEHTHHVVRVFDVGFSPERDQPFLVMELLEGHTLSARLSGGPLALDHALRLAVTVADTLAVAHEHGIIHRDLKPDNIMLVRRGDETDFIKLLDFGLVKMSEATVKTRSGRMMGTLQYMPPEQLKGQPVDARADVFSFGAVLYECLSGARANPGKTHGELFALLLDRGVAPLAERKLSLPPALTHLVDRCLALDVSERPVDGRALVESLRSIAAASGVSLAGVADSSGVTRIDVHAQQPASGALSGHVAVGSDAVSSATSLAVGELSVSPEWRAPSRNRGWVWLLGGIIVAGLAAFVGLNGGSLTGDRPAITNGPEAFDGPDGSLTDPREPVTAPGTLAQPTVEIEPADPALRPAPEEVVRPLRIPTGPLPERPVCDVRVDRNRVIYDGGTAHDRWARLVIDTTLSSRAPPVEDDPALERWAGVGVGGRRWLAAIAAARREPDGSLNGVAERADQVVVSPSALEGLRSEPPRTIRIRGLGTLLTHAKRQPLFERIRCGSARPGDQIVTARWSTPGYDRGGCTGADCPRALARALQKGREVAETIRLHLTLSRETVDDGETKSRLQTSCRIAPAGGRRGPAR